MTERHEVFHAQLLVPGVYRHGYPPHTDIYRFVANHRHSLLLVSAPPSPIAEVSVKQSSVTGREHNSPFVCKFRKTEVRSAFLTIMDIAFALSIFYQYLWFQITPPHCMDSGRNAFYGIDPPGKMKHRVIRRMVQFTNDYRSFPVIHILSVRPPVVP